MSMRRGRPPKGQTAMSTGERSAARRSRDRRAIWCEGDLSRASISGLASEIGKAAPDALRRILVELGRRRGLRVMIADAPGARFAESGARHVAASSGAAVSSQVASGPVASQVASGVPQISFCRQQPRVTGSVTAQPYLSQRRG